jgi:hypothetical protein
MLLFLAGNLPKPEEEKMSDEELLYLIEDDEKMRRAIERARELRPKVRVLDAKDRLFDGRVSPQFAPLHGAVHRDPERSAARVLPESKRRFVQRLELARLAAITSRLPRLANIYAQTVLRQIAARSSVR